MVDTNFFDQYSLMHFAAGIIFYYIGITLEQWFWISVIFEIIENSKLTIASLNKYLFSWSSHDFKENPDTFINSFGDILFAVIGWLVAYSADKLIFKREPTPIFKNNLIKVTFQQNQKDIIKNPQENPSYPNIVRHYRE